MLVLKKFKQGVWFDYPKYSGVKFKIKPASPSDLSNIISKIRTKVPIKINENVDFIDDVDKLVLAKEFFNYVLEEYAGITLEIDDGSTPSNDDIKEALYDNTEIKEFILGKANELFEKINSELEKEVKN